MANTLRESIDERVSIRLASYLFWEFCLYYDPEFFQKRDFLFKIADAFQQVHDQYIKGIAIKVSASMPPRSGKSYITSLFCAWWLGKYPHLSVMRNTCTATLYRKFSYDVRNIVRSGKFRTVFPGVSLADDKKNLEGWNLKQSKQVGYFGAGVGGTIIGFGANIALSDDLYKDMAEALSETVQDSVAMWKQSAHNSRMEKNCPELFIGTRWTKRDEIGKAIEKNEIDIEVTIPALVHNDSGRMVSFCEDVKSTAEYLKIKADTDEEIWEAEYMQNPIEAKGLLFPKSQLKFFDRKDVDLSKAEFKFVYIDPADTGEDSLSAPMFYLIGDKVFIPSVIFNRSGTDVNTPALEEIICTEKIDAVEIEGNSGWVLFGKDLRNKVNERLPDCQVRIIKNTTNKNTRILAQSAFIKNHFYFDQEFESDPQYRAFIKELTSYLRAGTNKHEDSSDSLAGGANYFRTRFAHLW